METFEYIVVGGGNSAGYVAKTFVDQGLEANKLLIVSEENYAPYERPALSKGFLFGKAKLPGFHTSAGYGAEAQAPEWYKEKGIELLLGAKVTKVNVEEKVVEVEGKKFQASKGVIFATGSDTIRLTRNPGHDLEGIYYLRDHADGEKILESIATAKSCIVIGGGYIGMECAAALASQEIEVTMVFPEEYLMKRLFPEELSRHYMKVFEAKGVKFMTETLCTEFVGENNQVRGCKVGDKVIYGDMVVVGVGARANVDLLADHVDLADKPLGGVVVDSAFETSVKGIYAIGDLCTFPLQKYNRMQRVEHVTHARQSATHLVNCLTGNKSDYDYLPHFYSRVFNLSWKFWGDAVGEVVLVGGFDPKILALWVAEGTVMGVFLESGSDEENALIKAAAEEQPKVDVAKLKALKSVEEAVALLK